MDQYDFVIIGGGASGLVVANRLSQDPSQRILVLEAGSDTTGDPRVTTPGFYHATWQSEMNWGFETVPQVSLEKNPTKRGVAMC
jgi:choline dehydrogenase-like flavoprotein